MADEGRRMTPWAFATDSERNREFRLRHKRGRVPIAQCGEAILEHVTEQMRRTLQVALKPKRHPSIHH